MMKITKIYALMLMAGLLSFSSCGEDEEAAASAGRKVSLEIPIEVRGMEYAGDETPDTRAKASPAELEIRSLYVVQFNGTVADSKVVAQGSVTRGANNVVNFTDFQAADNKGVVGRVYVVANLEKKLDVTTGSTTLGAFKKMIATFAPTTSVPATGLPMCGSADFDPGSVPTAPTITLTAMVAKLVVKYTVTGSGLFKVDTTPEIVLKNATTGTSYLAPTNDAVANVPTGLDYADDIKVGSANGTTYTYYVSENICGANSTISDWKKRSLKNIPSGTRPLYFELTGRTKDDKNTVTIASFIGDPSAPSKFNVKRNTCYTLTATINSLSTTDERITVTPDYFNLNVGDKSANCYIVLGNEAGVDTKEYGFSYTVRGNGYESTSDACVSTIKYSTLPSLAAAKSARVLWQTGAAVGSDNGVIKSVKLDADNGKVIFTIGTATEGNAVIGLFDGVNGTGTCLWSWHIWRLSSKPSDIVCTKKPSPASASASFMMMDRNLGAYNNTAGNINSVGLLYQWGRKDPFPGAGAWSNTEPSNIYGTYINASDATGTWSGGYSVQAVETDKTYGTEVWAVKHPTVFIKGSNSPYDWYYGSTRNDCLWGTPWGSTGNVDSYNGRQGKKSIYDPCPIGYRVPPQDTWNKAGNGGFANNGMTLNGINASFWFPAAGLRYYNSGSFTYSGYGCYWSSSPYSSGSDYGGILYFYNGSLNTRGGNVRSYGYSVRCVSESVSE